MHVLRLYDFMPPSIVIYTMVKIGLLFYQVCNVHTRDEMQITEDVHRPVDSMPGNSSST